MNAFFKSEKMKTETNKKSSTKKQTNKKTNFAAALVGWVFLVKSFLVETARTPFPSTGIPRRDGEPHLALREDVCFSASSPVCEHDRPAFLPDVANAGNLFLFSREPESGGWQAALCSPFEMAQGEF